MPRFERYFGVDYSGAETPIRSLKGLALYAATHGEWPREIPPPPSPRKYWTRRGLAEWLAQELRDAPPTLVGIDHGFSFPLRYFEAHRIAPRWPAFLDDFQLYWPTDEDLLYVDDVRCGRYGKGAERLGQTRWRRVTEEWCGAKSVFHFDVQGSVAKSTHAGIPWLRYLREQCGPNLHFWPFDGWAPPPGVSVVAEVYPSLWKGLFPSEERNPHQHDAYTIARWMQEQDREHTLTPYFQPELTGSLRSLGEVEGWILGVVNKLSRKN